MTALVKAAKDSGKYLTNRCRTKSQLKLKLTVLTLRKVILTFRNSRFYRKLKKNLNNRKGENPHDSSEYKTGKKIQLNLFAEEDRMS